MKNKWHVYPTDTPKKSGAYLITFDASDSKPKLMAEVADYYHKGELIFTRMDNLHGNTVEERLMDWISNPEHEVRAKRDGFYTVLDDKAHCLRPNFWTKLPKAPKGIKWAK